VSGAGLVSLEKVRIRRIAKRDYLIIYKYGPLFHHATFNNGARNQIVFGIVMKQTNLKSLSVDELWMLHEATAAALAEKLAAEKKVLEERLRLLAKGHVEQTIKASGRRPYPPVLPKFRNPDEPSETWAGRGKQPHWVRRQLRSGKRMDDLRIESVAA
jgi:DNA-binding protein H-NS